MFYYGGVDFRIQPSAAPGLGLGAPFKTSSYKLKCPFQKENGLALSNLKLKAGRLLSGSNFIELLKQKENTFLLGKIRQDTSQTFSM